MPNSIGSYQYIANGENVINAVAVLLRPTPGQAVDARPHLREPYLAYQAVGIPTQAARTESARNGVLTAVERFLVDQPGPFEPLHPVRPLHQAWSAYARFRAAP